MTYETIIGLEVHAQLLTKSKMFCSCSANYFGAAPNTLVCPVCLGMPGVLPVINQVALEYTVRTGLALNCTIPPYAKFDRKNYHYPDLVKGYQISQYDLPFCVNGWVDVEVDGQTKRIGIRRVHLEEDTGKLTHAERAGEKYSLIDFNRCGVPLMEIVSEADIRTPEEARQYLQKLRALLRYIEVSSGDMEAGAFRCDANVSVRPVGSQEFGVKVEVKNMNSFRAVKLALEYEVKRQVEVLQTGGRLLQETRGWDDERGITVSQRSKEYAHDYRYFPEPDLPPLVLTPAWVEQVRAGLPELPDAKRDRYMTDYGLSRYDATLLSNEKATAAYFEAALAAASDTLPAGKSYAKAIANWMISDLFGALNDKGLAIEASPVTPAGLVELIGLVEAGKISGKIGKEVFGEMFSSGKPASEIVATRGLGQISDANLLADLAAQVMAANPAAVADYHSGKETALRFLVGQLMKLTRGQANPALANQVLLEKLKQQRP